MKKLMIAAAVVCAAAMVQAATCTWSSGNIFVAADANGGWTSGSANSVKTGKKGQLVNMDVYLLANAEAYAAAQLLSSAELFAQYGGKDTTISGSNLNAKEEYDSGITINQSNPTPPDAIQYAVVIATYHDTNLGKDFYIATTAETSYNGTTHEGTTASIINLYGTAAGSPGWQVASVPEPTSGLLLLLGIGAMALRRRRA